VGDNKVAFMQCHTREAEAYRFISALVYERSRIRLDESKQQLIGTRLGKRLRQLGFSSLTDYCQLLRTADQETEITHALTTNFTHFLREAEHFDFLVEKALPALIGNRKRFRIWSAACATGEEPYSIAFYLTEHYPLNEGWDWQVHATDISTKALDKAINGIYEGERLDGIPLDWKRKYFQRGHQAYEGYFRIKPALRERVQFRQLNLLGPYDFSETFEVIFCRNVMIYFDRHTQRQLVEKLGRMLASRGFLLTGHAESLNGLAGPFRCLRPSIYQKQ
jgi:chemotaxis protein methyltransferase CheR